MTKSAPLAKNKTFVAALEKVIIDHDGPATTERDVGVHGSFPMLERGTISVPNWNMGMAIADFFKRLAFAEGKDGNDYHQVALTAAAFFDRHQSEPLPPMETWERKKGELLQRFSQQERIAIEEVQNTPAKGNVRRMKRNKVLQASGVAALGMASIGFGVWRQHAHDISRKSPPVITAPEGGASKTSPDAPVDNVIEADNTRLCPAPYIVGALGLFGALALLAMAAEMGQDLRKADEADYEKIINRIFNNTKTGLLWPIKPQGHSPSL